jgi:hypothetical protein
MLFPVVLFGAVWADLNRPLSGAEVQQVVQDFFHGRPISAMAKARHRLRGRCLAARMKNGLPGDKALAILGDTVPLGYTFQDNVFGSQPRATFWYQPQGVKICYRVAVVVVGGRLQSQWVVDSVHPTPVAEIAALFLPDRPRPR